MRYPNDDEWDCIYERKEDSFEILKIDNTKTTFNILDFYEGYIGIQLSNTLEEYNNRAYDLVNNYVMVIYFYQKGIPDEEWWISPGRDGQSVQFFPHFEDKHFKYHYWFGFYLESYYMRFSGLIDCMFHLLNIRYNFKVEPLIGFNRKVLKKLQTEEPELFLFLKALKENKIYKQVEEFRNNIAHNHRPNQLDAGFQKITKEDGNVVSSFGKGKYTTTTEFVRNIEESVELLAEIVDEIREKVQI